MHVHRLHPVIGRAERARVVPARVPSSFITFIPGSRRYMNSQSDLAQWIFTGAFTVVLASASYFVITKGLQIMGGGNSTSRKATRPAGIRKLNDYVWELYCPTETPDVEIVFFHGLQLGDFEEAYWETWLDIEGKVIWPKEWLSKAFPKARILSISYNSSASLFSTDPSNAYEDMYILGENLVTDIILEKTYDIGQNSPICLVGHSLGGLVIKQLLLSALKQKDLCNKNTNQADILRIRKFIENFKGVFYYATPHGGSNLADLATKLPHTSSHLLSFLTTLDTQRQRINDEFGRLRSMLQADSFAVAESKPMQKLGFHAMVVPEASARQDVDKFFLHPDATHITVCKAKSIGDTAVIGKLSGFISDYNLKIPDPSLKIIYRPQFDEDAGQGGT